VMRRRLDSRWEPQKVRETDRDIFLEVISSFEQFQAGMMAMVAVACVATADMLSPLHYNPATLYAVPVLACVRTRSRRFLWVIIVVCMVLVYTGYAVGPTSHVAASMLEKIRHGRQITETMVLMVGLFVHIWIGIDYPRRRNAESGAGRSVAKRESA
jgi:hypothetical protein